MTAAAALARWHQLVETFGLFGAVMVLVYVGLLASLTLSVAVGVRRVVRRIRVRRYLRQVHRAAYAERPGRAA